MELYLVAVLPPSLLYSVLTARILLLGSLLQIIPSWPFSLLSLEEGENVCLESMLSFLSWLLHLRSVVSECDSALPWGLGLCVFSCLHWISGLSSSRLLFQLPGLQCLLGYFVCQTKTWPFMSSGRIFIIHQWNYLWRQLCSQCSVGRSFECPLWPREKIST